MTVAWQYSLKSAGLIPPAPFFFLNVALAIWGLLCFHANFKISYSRSVKNVIGNLTEITLNLQVSWLVYSLKILILPIQEHDISFCLCDLYKTVMKEINYRSVGLLSSQVGLFQGILFIFFLQKMVNLLYCLVGCQCLLNPYYSSTNDYIYQVFTISVFIYILKHNGCLVTTINKKS